AFSTKGCNSIGGIAIIHGIAPKPQKGNIRISFSKEADMLVAQVEDDGIGRIAAKQRTKHRIHKSKAIQITQDRLRHIHKSRSNPNKNHFQIEDLVNPQGNASGTRVTIKTPFKKIW
ncbi:MAG: hypothetical protein AAFP19_08905, partial [Bacteroidota bacterium]